LLAIGQQFGSYPETAFGEISRNVRELARNNIRVALVPPRSKTFEFEANSTARIDSRKSPA
jgi:hypothetical protein